MNLLVAVLLDLFAKGEDSVPAASDGDTERSNASARSSSSRSRSRVLGMVEEADARDVEQGTAPSSPMSAVSSPSSRRRGRHSASAVHWQAPPPLPDEDYALGCGHSTGFPPQSELRVGCRELIERADVEAVLMIAVVVSSILVALDTPRLDPEGATHLALRLSNYAFSLLFLLEALCKSIAYGFALTPNAYLKSGWNVLDFVIVIVSVGSILAEAFPQLAIMRPLRALRALRPLRLIARNEGMKLVLSSLFEALPAVSNVFGVMLALQLVPKLLGDRRQAVLALSALGSYLLMPRA